jgi:NAD(P)H-hydrate epimerase
MVKKEPEPVISSREMHALEMNAEYYGIELVQLMENAGRHVAAEIAARCTPDKKVVIFCGLGGNGGDGFVAARHLVNMGFDVRVVLAGCGKEISHEAAARNFAAIEFIDVPIHEVSDSSSIPKVAANVVVDAVLGTGTKGKLKPPIKQLVENINSLVGFKVAVDVPTGIDSDTGKCVGEAVKADVTVTFHLSKSGLAYAKKYVGELVVKDIGLPKMLEKFAGPGDVSLVTRKREPTVHKGEFGRVLVIGGSETYSGAPTLASLAALRAGVDLVFLAAPTKTAHAISSMSPDLITLKLEGEHLKPSSMASLKPYVDSIDAVVLGPGLGLHEETKEFVKICVNTFEAAGKALVLDADALKAFGEFKRPLKVPSVLTPHAGEYARLTGQKLSDDVEERLVAVKKTAKELNTVILVKGRVDLICSRNRHKLNFTGNPGMAVGGTGDILAGIVGALLAQKADAFEAAVAGAFINGAAGDFVVNEIGHHLVATDLLEYIPKVMDDPASHVQVRRYSKGVKTSGSIA